MREELYKKVGDFKHLAELYQGRYSKVWACTWQGQTSQVVLKVYIKAKMRPRHLENVQRELAVLSDLETLRCSGIVGFLGSFDDKEAIYIVQEHCGRGDLFAEMHRCKGCFSEQWVACQVVIPVLQTLSVAHQRGVIHRDIKPENLFLTEAGALRLGDWGLAINQLQEKAYTRVGTLDYMAPEVLAMPAPEDFTAGRVQLEDVSGYTEKVDVWAVGVLVYELMAGRPPFEVSDAQGTADLIMYGQVGGFPRACSGLCVSFIQQALLKGPEQRPSATQLLAHPWLAAYSSSTPPQPPTGPQTPRQTREAAPLHCCALGHVSLDENPSGGYISARLRHKCSQQAETCVLQCMHGVDRSAPGDECLDLGSTLGSLKGSNAEAGTHDVSSWAIEACPDQQQHAMSAGPEESRALQQENDLRQGQGTGNCLWSAESITPLLLQQPSLSPQPFADQSQDAQAKTHLTDQHQDQDGKKAGDVMSGPVTPMGSEAGPSNRSVAGMNDMHGLICTEVTCAPADTAGGTASQYQQAKDHLSAGALSSTKYFEYPLAEQREIHKAAALVSESEQCAARQVQICTAPVQCEWSQTEGSDGSTEAIQLDANSVSDVELVWPAVQSIVSRLVSAATGCFVE